MTTPASQSGHHASFPLFDWLRFALASAVALGHEGVITWAFAGNLAVQVFFALSGWLIGGILLRTERAGLPRFFFNRGTRIWIPFVAAVGIVYLLGIARDGINSRTFEFLFYDLTFTHNWFIEKTAPILATMPLEGTGSHFWSIAVEEQFYLAAPLLVVLTRWGKALLPWALIAALCYSTGSWYGSISLGVLAAIVQYRHGNWHLSRAARWGLWAGVAIGAVLLVMLPPFYEWLAPPFAVMTVLATATEGARGKIGIFLGGVSYPLYLNHWIGMFAANAIARYVLPVPELVRGPIAYAIAVAAGAIAYILIDRNIQANRARFFARARGLSFAIVAYTMMAFGILGGTFWFRTGWL